MLIKPQTYNIRISRIDYSMSGNVIMMYCSVDDQVTDSVFRAGQFMLLASMINGVMIKRSYSIATTPDLLRQQSLIGFSIKRVENGVFSTRATQIAQVGDALTMTGGLGRMIDNAKSDEYLLISAGSGLSPIYSIYQDLLTQDRGLRVANIFGERTFADVLDGVHRDRVSEVSDGVYSQCFLSQDKHDGYVQGRVQVGIDSAIKWLGSTKIRIFLCGGPSMVDEVRDILIQNYCVNHDQIYFEKY